MSGDSVREGALEQRLCVSYEDLLADPVPRLLACGELISVDVDRERAAAVAEKHRFENYEQTGTLQFRRQGRAGAWRHSENFTPTVRRIADEVLGAVRARTGYTTSAAQ